MIQALSSKFQKQVSCFILFIFFANTAFAGREYLFYRSNTGVLSRGVSFPENLSAPIKMNTSPEPEVAATSSFIETGKQDKLKKSVAERKETPDENQKVDIGGPSQPEMAAFKAAGADNMVDLFTGDFSYNIPLGDVGGYPLNIFYNSGITMDQEASWVGLGWNINPGTITRNKRGVPDDFKGDAVTKELSIKPQITVGVSGSKGREIAGHPNNKNPDFTYGIFYNNYKGIGLDLSKTATLGIFKKNLTPFTITNLNDVIPSSGGSINASVSMNINSQTGVNVTPGMHFTLFDHNKDIKYGLSASASYNSRAGLTSFGVSGGIQAVTYKMFSQKYFSTGGILSFSSSLAFGTPSITPSIQMPITNLNINLGVALGNEGKVSTYKYTNLSGYYSEAGISEADKIQTKSAYGYLYYQQANGNRDALLDFNRSNDAAYTKHNSVIAIPNYTYDVFSISGQGTGGGFRAYRGDVGSVHDHYVRTRENAAAINAEIGTQDAVELGLNLNYVHTPNTAGEWQNGNIAREALQFTKSTGEYQAAYFKNPAEAAKVDPAFLAKLGNEDLVRIKLSDPGNRRPLAAPTWERFSNGQTIVGELPIAGNLKKDLRDRRTQVISYLTADEATYAGLDKTIRYYPENQFPDGAYNNSGSVEIKRFDNFNAIVLKPDFRKSHHLSEITVNQTDGKRYVYGIPVYNIREEEVSFNIDPIKTKDADAQLVKYDKEDLKNNDNGRDWFYQKDKVDAYAHSFLLTGLLSPDYVDVTGNGISDDDLGTAVKFNYTKILHPLEILGKGFAWKAPMSKDNNSDWAAYAEGLKTDDTDDKGHFTYGERELWYLNSIESKTMIAIFILDETLRKDGRAVKNDIDGAGLSDLGMKSLKRIEIYSKAEWLKAPSVRKPVKSIHFEYENLLCANTPDNATTGSGKLTLKKIWFTYNGNSRQRNKYSFKYHSNPGYNRASNDRWGTYKPASDNGSSVTSMNFALNNADFPYADQDKTTADANAAAWTLNEITLPSGGKIKVEFESDDYAYVQDRRAAQMFKIAGFGQTKTATPGSKLYESSLASDNLYVFINVPVAVQTKADIKSLYLDGVKQLFMKVWVKMPHDQYSGSEDYEAIPVYAKINDNETDNYGRVNDNLIWIKVKAEKEMHTPMLSKLHLSPMFYSSMQFMIKNLSSKAYPGSDVRENGPLGIFKALGGMLFNTISFLEGYYNTARQMKFCNGINLNKSVIRLNNPYLKKLGGGLRVKKVTLKDSWDQMTANSQYPNGMKESEYGQEYDYTTTAAIGGQQLVISSGVASYEPIVGAEENPFREILNYDDNQPLGPNERNAIELPLGEVYFPNAFVGYSKVTVRSIHRDNVKSGVGKTVTEFYTTRDFPTKVDYTSLDESSHVPFKSQDILRFLKVDVRRLVTLSQGFRIQTNDMNGKMHIQTSYNEKGEQVTRTENKYRITTTGERKYSFNNTVPMMTGIKDEVKNALMGKEIEVMTDSREHFSKAVTFNMNFNVNTNVWGSIPIPIPSFIPPVHYAETGYRSVSVLKIVNTFGILDEVIQVNIGSQISTKDRVYDAETGNVLVTETNNEFNKPVYTFNYPAHWAYRGMGGAYKNINAVYEHVRFQNGRLTSSNVPLSIFESGDELYVKDYSDKGAYDEPGCYPPGPSQHIPKPTDENGKYIRQLWVLDIRKDISNSQTNPDYRFIDKNGDPYSGGDVTIYITRSGKRNHVDASVGEFTSLANPIRTVTILGQQVQMLMADDNTKIINTTANTFKENWRVDQAWYTQEEVERTVRQSPLQSITLSPSAVFSAQYHRTDRGDGESEFLTMSNQAFEIFKRRKKVKRKVAGTYNDYYDQNSWVKYDIPSSLDGVTVQSAKLHLTAHTSNHLNPPYPFGEHGVKDPHYNGREEHVNFLSNQFQFKVSRMVTPWYTTTDVVNWKKIFDDRSGYYTTDPVFPWPLVVQHAPAGSFSMNFQPELKRIAQGLIDNRTNSTMTAGLKLSFLRDSRQIGAYENNREARWRFCFSPSINLDIQYYSCSSSDPLIYQGDPDNAPAASAAPAGYVYCITDEKVLNCYSQYDKQRINPYTKGVLGNWRADINYVYFDNRKEASAAVPTEELSKGGTIATDYKSFWIASTSLEYDIAINPDATIATGGKPEPWKWNAKPTQFNNKGFELENTDPLGRFNSGIYGYDQTLPTAVANNAKLRNIAYDGFEDYAYTGTACQPHCKPRRHVVIENAASHISNDVSHSGLSSLKLDHSTSISLKADVVSKVADETGYSLEVSHTTTTQSGSWVNPLGTGLQGKYFNLTPTGFGFFFNDDLADDAEDLLNTTSGYVSQVDPFVNMQSINEYAYNSDGIQPPAGIGIRSGFTKSDYFAVRWDGWIQAPVSGPLTLALIADDGMKVWIDDVQVTVNSFWDVHPPTFAFINVNWTAGDIHKIRINYFEEKERANAVLLWRMPGELTFVPVPKDFLYLQTSDADNTSVSGQQTCSLVNRIQIKDNAITDIFSPVQGQKMVFSAWVKEGTGDCHCSNFANNRVDILYNNTSTVTTTFSPAGKVIDGWQRYEGVFDIPSNATNIEIKLVNSSGSLDVYWDDLRIHPFNSNMKSFVYHPSTLRLMAEQDENNYSTFYEYDDEGILNRVKKETIQGIKTITETRSAIQKKVTQ